MLCPHKHHMSSMNDQWIPSDSSSDHLFIYRPITIIGSSTMPNSLGHEFLSGLICVLWIRLAYKQILGREVSHTGWETCKVWIILVIR